MKKILIVSIVSLFILVGCASKKPLDEGNKHYKTPEEIKQRLDNKDSFVFIVGSLNCQACVTYNETTIKEVLSEDGSEYTIDYIEASTMKNSELTSMSEDLLHGSLKYTPTTYTVVKGIIQEPRFEDSKHQGVTHGDVGPLTLDQLKLLLDVSILG